MQEDKNTELTEFEKLFPIQMVLEARKAVKEGRKINIKSDVGFKLFLCHDSDAARYCLASIIEAFTGHSVNTIMVKNAELLPEYIMGKACRLDVVVDFNDGRTIDMELQLKCEPDEERKRAMYYGSKLYTANLNKGDDYSKISNVYQVFITDFYVFDDEDNFHAFTMKDQEGNELTDSFQVMFLELPKLSKLPFDSTLKKVEFWGKIISDYTSINDSNTKIDGFEEELKMVLQSTEEISRDEKEWLMQMAIEDGMRDYEIAKRYAVRRGLEEGRQKGLEQGLKQGIEQGRFDSAVLAVREFGISPEKASETFAVSLPKLKQALNAR